MLNSVLEKHEVSFLQPFSSASAFLAAGPVNRIDTGIHWVFSQEWNRDTKCSCSGPATAKKPAVATAGDFPKLSLGFKKSCEEDSER